MSLNISFQSSYRNDVVTPLVNKFVTLIGRNQDRIARNFHIGLASLLGVIMSFLGILVNAFSSNAREVKRSSKVEASATNLVSIDHGSNSETTRDYLPQNFVILSSSYANTRVSSSKK